MKRAIIILILLSVSIFCFGILQGGIGTDFSGKHKAESSFGGSSSKDTWDVGTGISVYGEYMMQNGGFLYGAGAEYQVPREVKFDSGDGKVGFIPIYAVGRFQVPVQMNLTPEVLAQVGYNIFTADKDYKGSGDLTGGLYWGIGAGVMVQNFVLQLMYKVNTGKWEQDLGGSTATIDLTHSQINFSAGIRFK
jgi:hypothetical protein